VHLSSDAQTLEIRAIEITGNAIGDASILPELLSQIPADEQQHSVRRTVNELRVQASTLNRFASLETPETVRVA